MPTLNVGDIKRLLSHWPDDTEVVVVAEIDFVEKLTPEEAENADDSINEGDVLDIMNVDGMMGGKITLHAVKVVDN